MAVLFRSWSIARPYLLLLTLITTFTTPATADLCSFWDSGCVDPLAQTAISLSFPPLFLAPLNFYYAFDADARGKGQEPMIKASYWVKWQASINSSIIDINRTSEIAVRVGNLTGTPSGANNGCDGVWGSQCSINMKHFFQQALFELMNTGKSYENPLDTLIGSFHDHPPPIENCPPPFFDVQQFPVDQFAIEIDTDQTTIIKDKGNSEDPWSTWFIDNMTAAEQAEQVAVGIISRTPTYGAPLPSSYSGVDIELVCARAPSPGSSSSDD
ncbi:hypothetical protein BJY04DRAFT_15613 [Aspergillus karnatakaensis]|uniref:uncharacterized protein n=1 Tax=Aspergillus karnatakaensis TaxID=1810916 RepID=UPI003CCE328A